MTTTHYDIFVCTDCEANEVLAPVDSIVALCSECHDPDAHAVLMDGIRKALGLHR